MAIRESDKRDFADALSPKIDLAEVIDWIRKNLYPEDVFSKSDLEEWAKEAFPPKE